MRLFYTATFGFRVNSMRAFEVSYEYDGKDEVLNKSIREHFVCNAWTVFHWNTWKMPFTGESVITRR